jgi:hypothetical protein
LPERNTAANTLSLPFLSSIIQTHDQERRECAEALAYPSVPKKTPVRKESSKEM